MGGGTVKYTLRVARIVISLAVFVVLTVGVMCSAFMLPAVGPWLAKIQLVRSLMYFSLTIFVVWLLVTLMFGRIYCSSVCPLGTLQDISARAMRLGRNARRRAYRYRRADSVLRYVMLLVMLVSLMGGVMLLISVLDPFQAYQRVCHGFFNPLVRLAVNSLAAVGIHCPVSGGKILLVSVSACIIGTSIFFATVLISARHGRLICNTVCPVGTTLGLISRFSIFQMDIDTDKCIQCRRCEEVCKSECIDLTDHVVDGSRCVNCFNCINVCPNDAIRYTATRKRLSIPMMQRISGVAANNAAVKGAGGSACGCIKQKIEKPIGK